MSEAGAIALWGGDLGLGDGLLALLRPALQAVAPGAIVALRATTPGLKEELVAFCRAARHRLLDAGVDPDGVPRFLIERGPDDVPRRPTGIAEHAGLAPKGALIEPGAARGHFPLAGTPGVAELYAQAIAGQWNADRDVPWDKIETLPPSIDRAVRQVMTFLAENELAALYVPSRFIGRVHPTAVELAMFLSTQLADEARHIDVFLRRARHGGGAPGVSAAVTARSLLWLLEPDDFVEASFLLSVLGEGTFLDLLRFVETHAPDAATAELTRRARVDEARHVHFGLEHTKAAITADPGVAVKLEAVVARRAAAIGDAGVPTALLDALVMLAARSDEPAGIRRGQNALRELIETMDTQRRKRLIHAGFDETQAARLSTLHTPNFM